MMHWPSFLLGCLVVPGAYGLWIACVVMGEWWVDYSVERRRAREARLDRLADLRGAGYTHGEARDIAIEWHQHCPACKAKVLHAPGIGCYCPNPSCDRIDDLHCIRRGQP